MPLQETFLKREVNGRRLRVVKSYDSAFARDAFDHMEPMALDFLKHSLDLDSKYDPAALPPPSASEYAGVLWEEIEDGARESWHAFSYFVVLSDVNGTPQPLYVSPDWPSAESFCAELEKGASQNHKGS